MFENPRRGRQARNFTTNVPKILVLKWSSEQVFVPKIAVGYPCLILIQFYSFLKNCANFFKCTFVRVACCEVLTC